MKQTPTLRNCFSKQLTGNLKGSSIVMGIALSTLFSCSYLEDIVKPDDPDGTEKGFAPLEFNRPVGPVGADARHATFIDPTVTITGAQYILLEEQIYIGPFASLIAADDNNARFMAVSNAGAKNTAVRIKIGKETNVQDNVSIYAAFERNSDGQAKVNALNLQGVEIGERVILAHGSTIKGPAQIAITGSDIAADPDEDQEVFISFGAEIDGAILEKNTGVSALARVGPGVRLKSGFIVLPGKNVTTQEEAENPALGKVRQLVEADVEFNEAVLEVNIAFAREYSKLFYENPLNVFGINYDPGNTAFNPTRDQPMLAGQYIREPDFRNRIIGDVILANALPELSERMGNRISLRADEGEPFIIGTIKKMSDNVIFHALEESPIKVGDNVTYGEKSIVHGGGRMPITGEGSDEPTMIEDDVILEEGAVVFRSLIGKGARIGKRSAIVNTEVAPGKVIEDKVIYINNALFGPVEW